MIRAIDAAVFFLKQNELWALIDSMILMRNTRTAEVVPDSKSRNLQQFLTHSKWSADDVI